MHVHYIYTVFNSTFKIFDVTVISNKQSSSTSITFLGTSLRIKQIRFENLEIDLFMKPINMQQIT